MGTSYSVYQNPEENDRKSIMTLDDLQSLHAESVRLAEKSSSDGTKTSLTENEWSKSIDAKTLDLLITEMNEMNRWFAKVVKYWDDFTGGGDGAEVLSQNGRGITKEIKEADGTSGGEEEVVEDDEAATNVPGDEAAEGTEELGAKGDEAADGTEATGAKEDEETETGEDEAAEGTGATGAKEDEAEDATEPNEAKEEGAEDGAEDGADDGAEDGAEDATEASEATETGEEETKKKKGDTAKDSAKAADGEDTKVEA